MAATPIDPRVADRHASLMLELPGNAHGGEHSHGARAAAVIEDAAREIADLVDADAADITFAPGASAALFLAVRDTVALARGRRARVLVSAAEHPALLAHLRRAERNGEIQLVVIGLDDCAVPRIDLLVSELDVGADLVCAMAANNEVGTITSTAAIASLARQKGARLLVDASQAAGRIAASEYANADYLIISGAKMYGPRRTGALIAHLSREGSALAKDIFGSPDAPAAGALALAFSLRSKEMAEDEARIGRMRDRLQVELERRVEGLVVNGGSGRRIAGCLHISTPGLPGEAVVARLYDRISVSTGAACQTGVPGPSHVLAAMPVPDWVAEGAVRIGVGIFNTEAEIEEAGGLIAEAMAPSALRRCA